MKKAKIVLSAVALFALVGGALAFKAGKFNPVTFYRTTTNAAGSVVCTLPVQNLPYTTVDQGIGTFRDIPYSTKSTLIPCTTTLYSTLVP